ncbi:MAG: hypothetical protein QM648_05745 [Solirubrobacterales bacterium]
MKRRGFRSSLALGAAVAAALVFAPASLAADNATLDGVVEASPNIYQVTITSTFTGCLADYCAWYPIAYLYDSAKVCPDTQDAADLEGNHFLTGATMDYMGTEITTASVQSFNPDFKICVYHFHETTFHFAAELRTAITPPLSLKKAKSETEKYLAKKYSRKFKSGKSKKIACKLRQGSVTEAICSVKWSYRKSGRTTKYSGPVYVVSFLAKLGKPAIKTTAKIGSKRL